MSMYSVGIYDDPKTAEEIKEQIERERVENDRLIELNERALASDGHVGEVELHSSDDVGQWLRECGFDPGIADFYAESVRLGHNVIVFEAEQDDDHFERVAREMRECEPEGLQQMLERWSRGDRSALAPPAAAAGARPKAEAGETQPDVGARETERTEEEQRIPITEERVRVDKEARERGGATVSTHVEEVPVEKDVRLREERIDVERHPVDRSTEEGEQAFEERSVEMSERSEEPVVSKEARVVEEVTVGKETSERTARVQDVVRRTVVDVETYGGIDEERLRAEFEATGGGGDFGEYQTAARFGHAYGMHPELRDVEYEEAEPSLRERYEEKQGPGTFDRARDTIRSWWQKSRKS